MKGKLKLLLIILLISTKLSANNSITLDELNQLKKQGALSTEDYEILKKEITATEDTEDLYTLKVNGRVISYDYKIMNKDNIYYLNLNEFFEEINFKNYTKDKNKYIISLGRNLEEIIINLENKEIINKGKKEEFSDLKSNLFIESNNSLYLHKNAFERLFLNDLNIDNNLLTASMRLSFLLPEEINKFLDATEKKLQAEGKDNILLYKSKRQLFDLGYSRVTLERTFNKEKGEKSYKGEWNSEIEYQGGFLYGQLKSKYNFEDNLIQYVTLEYNDIWKGHTLNIENNGSKGQGRTWGLGFFKDKSYYLEGNKAIIKESVPVGSRAELRYMGTSIAIKNENNGYVFFDNDIIRADRTYELVIYYPDGKIVSKTITPVEDYNKQSKNEVQYTVYLNEDEESKKYTKDFNVFYGLTDNLTLGAGYKQGVEMLNDKYKYINDATASMVYGDTINGYSYLLNFEVEKSLDDYKYNEKSYKDKYKYLGDFQLNVNNFKYTFRNDHSGKFYDEKDKRSFEVEWDFSDNLDLEYTFEKLNYYSKKAEKKSNFSVSYDKSYKGILFSLGASIDEKSNQSYTVGLYHTNQNNISTKLETKWKSEDSKDMETTLTVYNNDFLGMFDYNFEIGYSERYKDKVTFNFSLNYDNWLKIASTFDKEGKQSHSIGLDRIIDLKNIRKPVDSLDVSRVKVITYIDENNNNIYEPYEKRIEDIPVTLGSETQITDSNGETIFYNVSNGVLSELKPTIKKPSYSMGENIVQVRSDFSSTVEAFIPIKPMMNLEGTIKIDPNLNLSEKEIEDLYEDILVEIKDKDGKSLELTVPDNTGVFDVSGLFPEEYIIEIQYVGTDYKVNPLKENLKLVYSAETSDFKVVFDFTKNTILARK